ncbi:MAG: hypothetical protein JWP97_5853 [Labilithrix sp.]|nr:hypothetical protein [Labilithrix sp.]
MKGFAGLLGRPFVDLSPYLDLSALPAVDDEVCLALAEVPVDYTGGSHRSMEIMPPSRTGEAHVDYGEVIAGLEASDYATFRSLASDPEMLPERAADATFGEEREHALSRRQMLWLEYRHGVYFPWKVYFEMIPNLRWEDKSSPRGKEFTRLARTFFPRTVGFVQSLPFAHVGRCNLMGLAAHDHGTVHRDAVPDDTRQADHFITFCPRGDKRLFLWDEEARAELDVKGQAYWFNDADYHGVHADPFFRYSIRVDGVFRPDFLATLERDLA